MVLLRITVFSQTQQTGDTVTTVFTLDQCVDYTLKNLPVVNQARIDEEINRKNIAVDLSGWLPQVSLDANLTHYLQLPVAFLPNPNNPSGPTSEVTTGLANTSLGAFSVNQTLYSNELAFAGRTVHDLKLRASQNTINNEINAQVNISKSFYNLALSIEQLDLWNEEIARLMRSYEDALHLYQSGVTDKIDYQQALIQVNNAKVSKRGTEESIIAGYAVLKQMMGFPPQQSLRITYDSAAMENDILADTMKVLTYERRIEYQQSVTDLKLLNIEIKYYRWSFLPSLSGFFNYNLAFYNSEFQPLYNRDYPYSLIGLSLNLPIFQGTSRLQKLQRAKLQYHRLELGQADLKNHINTQYFQAMASYKSNLYGLQQALSNSVLAQQVYEVVTNQYTHGIKTYLDLIVAETALRTAKLNYLTAVFQVLSSKVDLRAAMGDIVMNK